MNDEFEPLNCGEILSVNYEPFGRQLNLSPNGFINVPLKAEQFTEVITKRLPVTDNQTQDLFNQGINCEVLKFGADGWQKGRLRAKVILEFCPESAPIEGS